MKKQMLFKTKGMNRDLSVSAFNPEFAFENMNLRLSTNEGNTLLSWVNEKGTDSLTLYANNAEYWSKTGEANRDTDPHDDSWAHHAANSDPTTITGTPIGTAVINHALVLFTTGSHEETVDSETVTVKDDCIYVLKYNDDKSGLICELLYCGDLGFNTQYPLETLTSYEAEHIQKVYWTDGLNQPRMVNIVGTFPSYGRDTQFDFVPTLALQEEVTVSKTIDNSGSFASGVIQYAFTYYNKYGPESNIFYVSPLRFIAPIDRGGRPDEKVSNAFKITVSHLDRNFDYLRIYSISRSSLNGTPFCKRVTDIYLKDIPTSGTGADTVSYLDTGTSGDSIDPMELLYKGGEEITAGTIEQKDGTLFFGNIGIKRNMLLEGMKEEGYYDDSNHKLTDGTDSHPAVTNVNYSTDTNTISVDSAVGDPDSDYYYYNQLSCKNNNGEYGVPCAGFKTGDTYRLGVQFQHNSGKWSDPFYIGDYTAESTPAIADTTIHTPRMAVILSNTFSDYLKEQGYIKARPLVVYPDIKDRNILCQGVVCPTVYKETAIMQSSWFFRPQLKGGDSSSIPVFSPSYDDIPYTNNSYSFNPTGINSSSKVIRQVEIQGVYDLDNRFYISKNYLTLHSPDVEFDDVLSNINYNNTTAYHVKNAKFTNTYSDIDIQTETPTISNRGGGFIHKSFHSSDGPKGIISGLFYDDFVVDDGGTPENVIFNQYAYENSSYKWLIYPWHRTGSLNNDVNRPSDKGTQSAKLKKKVISNLRYAITEPVESAEEPFTNIELFNSDEISIAKLGSNITYLGNIDTVLNPDKPSAFYFAFDSNTFSTKNEETSFDCNTWWRIYGYEAGGDTGLSWDDSATGLFRFQSPHWYYQSDTAYLGNIHADLVRSKDLVRMKYKSTPHLVLSMSSSLSFSTDNGYYLPIFEIRRTTTPDYFGGTSLSALRENTWLPCGKAKPIGKYSYRIPGDEEDTPGYTELNYNYGDTYFQRYDCLKTYPFTREDENQIVEIGSFMLETHVNIDGRYDRNRGQASNLNMTPQNFNLINPVYSQKDNFFSYKIMDEESYEHVSYPNQIAWSKTKESGADVDMWTNVTLASTLELDGDKGGVNKLARFNNYLFAFQDSGIVQILYNDNVQVSSTDGVPIEIANSGKVNGKDYKSNTIGCSNKWSMVNTPNGIYFMDSNDKSIYLFNGQLQNLSSSFGFNSWAKKEIPAMDVKWNPVNFGTETECAKSSFMACFDKKNQDVLFINKDNALAYSEKLGVFTSFYDYGNTPFFCNLDDTGIWIRNPYTYTEGGVATTVSAGLWKHQAGNYGRFFNAKKPYWMTLVGNPEPQRDKQFTNLEFRACVDGDMTTGDNPVALLPFDSLEAWDEYQHGITSLENKNGHDLFKHGGDSSALIRKFRIWRCDIPRNNYPLETYPVRAEGETETHYEERIAAYNTWLAGETDKGISRHIRKPNDRMRNPWIYIKLLKQEEDTMYRTEMHDVMMTYFT